MTSLIDVIFLLLLFFMLTSTFTRFSEIELMNAAAGQVTSQAPPLFLRLSSDGLSLNGRAVGIEDLPAAVTELAAQDTPPVVLINPVGDVSSQHLVDLLARLRQVPQLSVRVLGGG